MHEKVMRWDQMGKSSFQTKEETEKYEEDLRGKEKKGRLGPPVKPNWRCACGLLWPFSSSALNREPRSQVWKWRLRRKKGESLVPKKSSFAFNSSSFFSVWSLDVHDNRCCRRHKDNKLLAASFVFFLSLRTLKGRVNGLSSAFKARLTRSLLVSR